MMLSDVCLTSVCLSVAYIGPKWRTERPMKTKIGTKAAHVTRDSDTIFKVKSSKVKVTRDAGHIVQPPAYSLLHTVVKALWDAGQRRYPTSILFPVAFRHLKYPKDARER